MSEAVDPEAQGRAAAQRFRREHHLGVQPLGDLVTIIEQTVGVDVAVLDVGPDEHGLAMRDPKRDAVVIGVARTRHPMRQRSTLAHELGHVIFADWTEERPREPGERSPRECRCRAFARHLLLPVAGLREFLGDRDELTPAVLSSVVQRYLVSPAIAAIALAEAGYLDAATSQEWGALYTPQLAARFGWSDQYRALQAESDQRRAPQRLLARAITGYTEGVLSAQAIATLRGISIEDTESELSAAGIEPASAEIAWAQPGELPEPDVDLAELARDLTRPGEPAEHGAG